MNSEQKNTRPTMIRIADSSDITIGTIKGIGDMDLIELIDVMNVDIASAELKTFDFNQVENTINNTVREALKEINNEKDPNKVKEYLEKLPPLGMLIIEAIKLASGAGGQ